MPWLMKSYERNCTVRFRIEFSCTGCRRGGICRAKLQQILHNLLRPLRLLQNHAQVVARALRKVGILHQQVGETEDGGQRIVHLMRHAGNQLPYRRHFFGMDQFRSQDGGIGHVGHHHHNARHLPILAD